MNKEHTFICGERIDPEIINEFINDGKKINKLLKDIEEVKGKPPLGVAPCRVVAYARISALAEAIERQLNDIKPDVSLIKRWANEIENQCDLIEYDGYFDE